MFTKIKSLGILLLLVGLSSSCSTGTKFDEPTPFLGRKVELAPFFNGFPYTGFSFSVEAQKVFYFHDEDKKILMVIDFEDAKKGNFDKGKVLSDIDFSKRTFWNPKYNPKEDSLYWEGDEDNSEIINLYKMDLKTLEISVLTNVRYIYDYQFNKDFTKAYYVARVEDGTDAKSEVQVVDLKNKKIQSIAKDNQKLRYYWGKISLSDDASSLIVNAIYNKTRDRKQLVRVDTKTGQQTPLLNFKQKRMEAEPLEHWMDPNHFFYTSDEGGNIDIYLFNLRKKRSTRLTKLKSNARNVHYHNGQLLFIENSPVESKLVLLNRSGNKFNRVYDKTVSGQVSIEDVANSGEFVSATSSFDKMVHYTTAKILKNKLTEGTPIVQLNPILKNKLVHTEKIEDLTYETFDIDPKTKKKRKIPALLYHPKDPLKGPRKMAMIKSFYGYRNNFSTEIQVLQAAGIYVLTPGPRGSSGLGREYLALNDGDLGGNEIIDIVYGGRFLQEKLNLKPNQIGVFGHSHGGYATMRLMTFPGEANGNKADFSWGFGIAESGFSDIDHFYRNCNIPTWVIQEAGDPDKEPKKIRSRSPLYNTQHFRGRLLIIHGENDKRVPVEGSRQMAEKLKQTAPERVIYQELPGLGHSFKGVENNIKVYGTWLKFLEDSTTTQ